MPLHANVRSGSGFQLHANVRSGSGFQIPTPFPNWGQDTHFRVFWKWIQLRGRRSGTEAADSEPVPYSWVDVALFGVYNSCIIQISEEALNQREIREFRGNLRQFERVTNLHLKSCCADVTLAQCLVLMEVEGNERPTVGRLASRLRLDSSTLTRTLDGLETRGLVERIRDDGDRRVVRIELTPRGGSVCRTIHRNNDAHYRRVFQKISPSRRATVIRSFELLVQALLDCEAESNAHTCRDSTESPRPTQRRSERLTREP